MVHLATQKECWSNSLVNLIFPLIQLHGLSLLGQVLAADEALAFIEAFLELMLGLSLALLRFVLLCMPLLSNHSVSFDSCWILLGPLLEIATACSPGHLPVQKLLLDWPASLCQLR